MQRRLCNLGRGVLEGGGLQLRQTISRCPPPLNILKLNFDRSYIKGKNQGGPGGIFRTHDGNIICNYSRLVVASDENEEEIYFLSIGCRELNQMSGFNSIVEGDSNLAVLWGLSSHAYPWRLADWVEEICSISTYLSLSFHHVLCDSNSVANFLAGVGVSRTNLAFDV